MSTYYRCLFDDVRLTPRGGCRHWRIDRALLSKVPIKPLQHQTQMLLSTTSLHYNQPYFTFLLTHITFSLVFPLHLAVLYLFRKQTIATYLDGIRHVIAAQVGGHGHSGWKEIGLKWSMKVGWLTLLISVPALSWFVAMVFTSAMDVTAIYATSSFHAYFFSMILLKTPLSRKTVASIVLAFTGVIVISFAGSGGATEDRSGPRNRALGDTVMMFGEYSSYDSIRCPR